LVTNFTVPVEAVNVSGGVEVIAPLMVADTEPLKLKVVAVAAPTRPLVETIIPVGSTRAAATNAMFLSFMMVYPPL
jgi:hypothetical protein